MDDLRAVLGPDLPVSHGDLNRPSLALQTIRLPSQAERLAWLADQVPLLPGHGIIYTLTVRDAVQVADWLRSRGVDAESYTSETGESRADLERALLENRVKALVATTALGMGFDKPDLAFVIHYQTPGSVVAYYQQVGRAGRALHAAYYEKGGTWAGAVEQLEKFHFVPIYTRVNGDAAKGLQALNHKGALRWPNPGTPEELAATLTVPAQRQQYVLEAQQLSWLAINEPVPEYQVDAREEPGDQP